MPDDQSNIPTKPVPPPESPPLDMTPSVAAAMLGVGGTQFAGGAWQPPTPEELQRDFPQYEIHGILGRGGMGAVYKGWQKSLDRFVAIKILPPNLDDEHGIIHRDIKPSNIMLDERGTVKVADFGLAKSTSAETTVLTMSNTAMGTPDFMAPEARKGAANVDHRADLYAVGVMLYGGDGNDITLTLLNPEIVVEQPAASDVPDGGSRAMPTVVTETRPASRSRSGTPAPES